MNCKGSLNDQMGLLPQQSRVISSVDEKTPLCTRKLASPSPENCALVAPVGIFTCVWAHVCVYIPLSPMGVCVWICVTYVPI